MWRKGEEVVCPCHVGLACKNKKLKLKFKNSLLPFSLAHTATKNNGWGNSFRRISTTAVFASITTRVNPMARQVGLKALSFNWSNKITSFRRPHCTKLPTDCWRREKWPGRRPFQTISSSAEKALQFTHRYSFLLITYARYWLTYFQIGNAVPPPSTWARRLSRAYLTTNCTSNDFQRGHHQTGKGVGDLAD